MLVLDNRIQSIQEDGLHTESYNVMTKDDELNLLNLTIFPERHQKDCMLGLCLYWFFLLPWVPWLLLTFR